MNQNEGPGGLMARKVCTVGVKWTLLAASCEFSREGTDLPAIPLKEPLPAADPGGPPSIFTALQEQLGLRLESGKGPVDTLVIDHIERPSEN